MKTKKLKTKILSILLMIITVININFLVLKPSKNLCLNINNQAQNNLVLHNKNMGLQSPSIKLEKPIQSGYKKATVKMIVDKPDQYNNYQLLGLKVFSNGKEVNSKVKEGFKSPGLKHITMYHLYDGYQKIEYMIIYNEHDNLSHEMYTNDYQFINIKHQTSPGVIAAIVIVPIFVLNVLGAMLIYFYRRFNR